MKTKADNIKTLEFKDPAIIGANIAKELKSSGKADIVIALTHMGSMQNSVTEKYLVRL